MRDIEENERENRVKQKRRERPEGKGESIMKIS